MSSKQASDYKLIIYDMQLINLKNLKIIKEFNRIFSILSNESVFAMTCISLFIGIKYLSNQGHDIE